MFCEVYAVFFSKSKSVRNSNFWHFLKFDLHLFNENFLIILNKKARIRGKVEIFPVKPTYNYIKHINHKNPTKNN